MKFLYDYFPIICFFIAFKFFGIYIATGTAMAAAVIQLVLTWLRQGHVDTFYRLSSGLILFLGALTLIFHQELFIKWKPSVIYWVLAIILLTTQRSKKTTLIERLLSDKISLKTPAVWSQLNFAWAIFFLLMGITNLYVVYHYDTNTWVNFKLIGTLGMTFLFTLAQTFYLIRHIDPTEKEGIAHE